MLPRGAVYTNSSNVSNQVTNVTVYHVDNFRGKSSNIRIKLVAVQGTL